MAGLVQRHDAQIRRRRHPVALVERIPHPPFRCVGRATEISQRDALVSLPSRMLLTRGAMRTLLSRDGGINAPPPPVPSERTTSSVTELFIAFDSYSLGASSRASQTLRRTASNVSRRRGQSTAATARNSPRPGRSSSTSRSSAARCSVLGSKDAIAKETGPAVAPASSAASPHVWRMPGARVSPLKCPDTDRRSGTRTAMRSASVSPARRPGTNSRQPRREPSQGQLAPTRLGWRRGGAPLV